MSKKTTIAKLKSTLVSLQKVAKTEKDADLKALIASVVALLDGNALLTPTPKAPKAPKVKKEKKVKTPKAPKAPKVKAAPTPKTPKVAPSQE